MPTMAPQHPLSPPINHRHTTCHRRCVAADHAIRCLPEAAKGRTMVLGFETIVGAKQRHHHIGGSERQSHHVAAASGLVCHRLPILRDLRHLPVGPEGLVRTWRPRGSFEGLRGLSTARSGHPSRRSMRSCRQRLSPSRISHRRSDKSPRMRTARQLSH